MRTQGNELLIIANGTSICYNDLGEGTLPLIFFHGFPFNKSSWDPQMNQLKKAHRVLSFDLRGYGKSETGSERFSMDLFADDLVAFMDALKIEQAIVCGLSMGGYILLNALNRYASRFAAVVFADTQCIADTPEGREKRHQTAAQVAKDGMNGFTEGFIGNIFSPKTLDARKDIVEGMRQMVNAARPAVVVKTLMALGEREETCSTLGDIKVPTLILCGEDDKITPPTQADKLHKGIAGSELNIIENAGHVSNIEQAEVFNSHVESFIRKRVNMLGSN